MTERQDEDAVLVESQDGITRVTINRPGQLNTINDEVISGLNAAWHRFNDSEDRCAILTGTGDRAFCAGADLSSFGGEMWEAVPGVGVAVAKPIVAAVRGHCIGGGCVLMSHCDLVVAGDNSRFWYPEAQVGFTGGVVAGLASRMPLKFAMEFALLGEKLSAADALRMALINRIVPDQDVAEVALGLARTLSASAPLVVRAIKQMMLDTVPRSPMEQAGLARARLDAVLDSADRQEGVRAFHEKRAPVFEGR